MTPKSRVIRGALVPLPNEDAGYSNTGLRRLQEILLFCVYKQDV
jgi:hypothetical protein